MRPVFIRVVKPKNSAQTMFLEITDEKTGKDITRLMNKIPLPSGGEEIGPLFVDDNEIDFSKVDEKRK